MFGCVTLLVRKLLLQINYKNNMSYKIKEYYLELFNSITDFKKFDIERCIIFSYMHAKMKNNFS